MAVSSARRLVQALLHPLGLELRSTSADLRTNLARAEQRTENARRRRHQDREAMLQWKAKCRAILQREAELQVKYARLEEALARNTSKKEVALNAALQKERQRLQREHESHLASLQKLGERVEAAEHLVWSGRENLSVVELRLDLVSSAINTLDRRYRSLVSGPSNTSE